MTRFASANLTNYLALASAMFIVGTSVVASKIVVDTLPIFTGSAIRFLIAAVILLAIVGRAGGIPRLPARLHLIIALQALAGIVLFNALLMLGLDLTTAIASGIITSTTPAVIAMMSLALGDRLRLIGWIGVTLAVLGVVIVNLFGAIPVIGEPLSLWIRGDYVVSDATLNRFFAFHVIALPPWARTQSRWWFLISDPTPCPAWAGSTPVMWECRAPYVGEPQNPSAAPTSVSPTKAPAR